MKQKSQEKVIRFIKDLEIKKTKLEGTQEQINIIIP